MNKEEFLKAIMELPKVETDNPISTMNSINVDDLMSVVDKLNKVPDYNDLIKENKKLKKQVENYKKLGFKHLQDKNNNLENQQKEFIKYLQEELNVQIQEESIGCEITNKRYILEEILLKYKKIIGNDINVGSKGVKDE